MTGIVYYLRCNHAKSRQKQIDDPIFIYPNFTQQKNTRDYTTESIQHSPYFYVGGDYACERQLIERYTCDLISTPHSWQKQVDSLNIFAFNTNQFQEVPMNMRRFSQILYTYKILEMDLCLGSTNVSTPKEIDQFDAWRGLSIPVLYRDLFIYGQIIKL